MTVTDQDLASRRRRDTRGTVPDTRVPAGRRQRSVAAERALERRRKRLGTEAASSTSRHWQRSDNPPARIERPPLWARVKTAPSRAIRRVPFVVVVVGMLLAGLALTLWLSTKSAQDSYELGVQREYNEQLSDRRDALKKEYESGDSAPELSAKAGDLGMIPATDVPRMVVGPDGSARVVGEIKAAEGAKAPSLNNAKPATPTAPATRDPASPTTSAVQGIPVQGTPVAPDASPTAPAPSTPVQTPAPVPAGTPIDAVAPPAYSNVLPSTGGAPGANSGQGR